MLIILTQKDTKLKIGKRILLKWFGKGTIEVNIIWTIIK